MKKKKTGFAVAVIAISACVGVGAGFTARQIARSNSISEETAKKIVLADAGLSADDIQLTRSDFGRGDGIYYYDIEFETEEGLYLYKINARTGQIQKKAVPPVTETASAAEEKTVLNDRNSRETASRTGGSNNEASEKSPDKTAAKTSAKDSEGSGASASVKDSKESGGDASAKDSKGSAADASAKDSEGSSANASAKDPKGSAAGASVKNSKEETSQETAPSREKSSGKNGEENKSGKNGSSDSSSAEKAAPSGNAPSGAYNSAGESSYSDIGVEKAKEIALADAGVRSQDAVFSKAQLDDEDGIPVYELEFFVGAFEYDYAVNIYTGEIVEREMEPWDEDVDDSAVYTPEAVPTYAPEPETQPVPPAYEDRDDDDFDDDDFDDDFDDDDKDADDDDD